MKPPAQSLSYWKSSSPKHEVLSPHGGLREYKVDPKDESQRERLL
jgi:hypothetical protein